MKWQIVTDSSCDRHLFDVKDTDIGFSSVPFTICVDEQEFLDDAHLDHEAMMQAMDASRRSHTSCPSPGAWYDEFMKADQVLAITISGNLSGSLQSASIAREIALEDHPEKKIEVIDSLSTGPKLVLLVERLIEEIEAGVSIREAAASARRNAASVHTLFTLCSFRNLVQNGRINNVVGFLAEKLKVRVIGEGSREGRILLKHKLRGRLKTLNTLLLEMEKSGFKGGVVAISHCCNEELAIQLSQRIREKWRNTKVQIMQTRGLCSYYAEREGVILAY